MGEATFPFSKPACYIAEFLGTFMLIFTIGCNVITGQAVWGGVSIACVLMVMIYALGGASGANFNPAVSLALALSNKLPWAEACHYMVVQLLGGIVAAFAYVAMFGMRNAFNLAPTPGHTWWQACLVETIYTFMLCFVVLNVAASKKIGGKNEFYGLAIGFVIVAGAYGAGSVSMGCFNPAVALALDTASFWIGFTYGPLYMLFEFAGAFLASVAFKACRPEEAGEEGAPEQYPMTPALISEFLGTYMLVLTVGLNVLGGSKAGAFSIAASLMCMIFALGSCSGAHFNPAVTCAIMARGDEGRTHGEYGQYIAAQIVGGVAAAFTYTAVMNGETFALKPTAYDWAQVVAAEFVFTFVLCFVVLTVATVKAPNKMFFGLAIGMCVTVGGFAIGKVSGGSLNPAVSIGISSSHMVEGGVFVPCIAYSLVEIVAGVAAAQVFKLTHPSEFDHEDETKPLKEAP
jgi:aquaporin Z